jgi:hypothetical protein
MAAAFPQRGEVWLVDFPNDPKLRAALIRAERMSSAYFRIGLLPYGL